MLAVTALENIPVSINLHKMFISRAQIIFLLVFIGSQRSKASPTIQVSSLEVDATEQTNRNDLPQTLDGKKEEGPEQHWECQPESNYIQEQISLTTKMLHDGDEVTNKQKDLSADETVLVLGKAGSGKTSLVQFLTENPKLLSKKIQTETGEYIIEDGEKIGTSATESYTLYPEIVNYTTINFCDSPGFHDSRSSAHEIVSMDVMKSITNRFKKTKILLLETHSSLQYGLSKDSFINTLRHLNDFVVDIDKYKDHIALIATKIPLTFKAADDINVASRIYTTEIVTEEIHIESIMKYLNQTKTSLEEKLELKISKIEKEFYQKVIRLLQSLLTRDENGKATRINVFRRPYKSGPLKNMTLLEKNRDSLLQTVINLDYVDVEKNDFDFTLSDTAKLYLECLLKLTNDNYKSKINEISFKLGSYINNKTSNYSSIYEIASYLDSLSGALKQLSYNLEETNNYNEFFEKINDFISYQKIPLQYNYNERIHTIEKYEKMLLRFVDTSAIFVPSSWTSTLRQVIKSLEEEVKWYHTLIKLIDGLSSHKIQMQKSGLYRTIYSANSTSTNSLMSMFMDVTGNTDFKQFIEAQADERKKSEIELITKSMLQKNNISCDTNGRLIVKGLQVRLAEINSEDLVQLYCNGTTLKEVALLAVDRVFLDVDTIDIFKGVNMFIAAPNWEIIGQRTIDLSGHPGPEISDNNYVDNGRDGKPGLPGGNGGSFFGVGLHFSNGENLCIESNGGRGGPGSDGTRGERGKSGRNGREKAIEAVEKGDALSFLEHAIREGYESHELTNSILIDDGLGRENISLYEDNDRCNRPRGFNLRGVDSCFFRVLLEVDSYKYDGDCGSTGGPGGFGGEAGIGGLPGEQKLVELDESSQIHLESSNGSKGYHGNMGEFGERGLNGVGLTCYNIIGWTVDNDGPYGGEKSYWKCFSSNTSSTQCREEPKQNRTIKYIDTGIKQPSLTKFTDFAYYLLDYAALLQAHTDNTIFHKIISDFKEALRNKYSHNLNEMGLLFFKKSG